MLLTYLPLSDDFINRSASFIDASISISLIIVYLILYKLMFREKLEPEVRLSKPQSTLFTIIISFGVGGVSTIWLELFEYISKHFQSLNDQVQNFSTLYDDMEQSPYIWTLLAIAIVGPIVEEIMFRGLIYRSLEKAIETPWIPIVISGVMFGAWHGSFIQGVYTAILGMILAYYYKKTRSLFLVIMVHIINNFLSTLPPAWADRQHDDLVRREPEGEVPCSVLDEDSDEALHGAEGSSVDHHRAMLLIICPRVFEVEALGEIVVYLDRT